MQVSLKRADYYAKAALKLAGENNYDATIALSIYAPALSTKLGEDLQDMIAAKRGNLLALHQMDIALIAAAYDIRRQLAEVNSRAGIGELLTQNARLGVEETRTRALLRAIEEARKLTGNDVPTLLSKAEAMRTKTSENLYGRRDDDLSVCLVSEADEQQVRQRLRRLANERVSNNDRLTALNVTNTITLSEATVATLSAANILTDD